MKLLTLLFTSAALLALPACSTTSKPKPKPKVDVTANVEKTLPYLRTASALAATGVLISAQPPQRKELANYLSSVAVGLRTLTGTNVPTPEQVKLVTTTFGKTTSPYQGLATTLASLYAGVFPKLNGNAALAQQVIERLASGIEDAAASYL